MSIGCNIPLHFNINAIFHYLKKESGGFEYNEDLDRSRRMIEVARVFFLAVWIMLAHFATLKNYSYSKKKKIIKIKIINNTDLK